MQNAADKNILVVGGSSGIGAEIVKLLLGQNARVFCISRTAPSSDKVIHIQLDVTSDFSKIENLPDHLDGLVYCPGSIRLKPFQSLKPDDYLSDFEINVLGAVKVIKAALKPLKNANSASIVMFSTVAVKMGMNFHASIAASKGAVEGLVRSLAAELAGSKINVNAIAPSITDTPLAASILNSEEKRKMSEDRHPLKQIGKAEEIASFAVSLLSDSSKWMTGQVIAIDGGISSVKPL